MAVKEKKTEAVKSIKPETKTETLKVEEKKKAGKTTLKPSETKKTVTEKKEPIGRYHISLDKELNKWKVKLADGGKVIKLFNTQKEAIEYADSLCQKNGRGFVVHSKKGKIRKV